MTLEDGLEESEVHMSHEKVCRTKSWLQYYISLFVWQDSIYSNFMYSNVFCKIVLQDFIY